MQSPCFARKRLLVVGMIAVGWSHAAMADTQIETVTVTASRRVENEQRVPLAVNAVSGDMATKAGITNLDTLAEAVPGVVFNQQATSSVPFIRGVGTSNTSAGDELSVALFVDDVYIPFAGAGTSNFNSIDRIEVDMGPQGTLFGRNATGGVVQVLTKNPTPELALDVSAGFANYNTPSGSLYATGELSQDLTANVAVYGSKQFQGWGHNLFNGNPTFQGWDYGGRAKMLFTPSNSLTLLLTVDHDTTHSGLGLNYKAREGTRSVDGTPSPPGYYDTYGNLPYNAATNHQSGVSLKATQDFDWAQLVSITAYRYSNYRFVLDLDQGVTPGINPLVNASLAARERTWTQEFRLLSPDADAAFKWIVGFYYFGDNAGYAPITLTGNAFGALSPVSNYGVQKTNSYSGFGDVTVTVFSDTHVTGGLRYTVDDRSANVFDLVTPAQVPPSALGIPGIGGQGSATFSKLTGRAIIDHQFTDDIMAYVAYNRGFKSGLFNTVALMTPMDPAVRPETLDAYSIGAKSEFFNSRLRINAEAFYYSYKNMQVQVQVNDTSHTTNAAAATMKGFEIDATAVPIDNLTLTGSIGVTNGRFDDFPNGSYLVYVPTGGNCAFSQTSTCGLAAGSPNLPPHFAGSGTAGDPYRWNLAGNTTPNTPPLTTSLTIDYDYPTSVGAFDFNFLWSHSNGYYFNADNGRGQIAPSSPNNDKQRAFDILNGSINWTSLDGSWDARLWMKNIADQHYILYGDETAFATLNAPAPPRTFGITLTKHL